MSLADFWDNITTPGFLESALDEFKDICRESGEEFKEIFEDGQELLTDALQYSIIEKKGVYAFTSEKRKEAVCAMKEAQEALLMARGVDEKSQFLFDFAQNALGQLLKELQDNPSATVLEKAQHAIAPVPLATWAELAELQTRLLQLLQLAEAPKYQAPQDNFLQINLGPSANKYPDRGQRKQATNIFLQQAKAYQENITAQIAACQQETAPFDLERLDQHQQNLLQKLCDSLSFYTLKPSSYLNIWAIFARNVNSDDETGENSQRIVQERAATALQRLSCINILAQKTLNQGPLSTSSLAGAVLAVIERVVAEIPLEDDCDESEDDEE